MGSTLLSMVIAPNGITAAGLQHRQKRAVCTLPMVAPEGRLRKSAPRPHVALARTVRPSVRLSKQKQYSMKATSSPLLIALDKYAQAGRPPKVCAPATPPPGCELPRGPCGLVPAGTKLSRVAMHALASKLWSCRRFFGDCVLFTAR